MSSESSHSVGVYIDPAVAAVRELHGHTVSNGWGKTLVRTLLAHQAETLYTAHQAGNPVVVFDVACWCPERIGWPREQIMSAKFTEVQARMAIARAHGFTDWQAVEELSSTVHDAVFERTVDLALEGHIDALGQQLQARGDLIRQRSVYGHGATLLHYMAANGVETHRQITPLNAADIVKCLIDSGADVNAGAAIYGHNSVLSLMTSSAHPANAGVLDAVVQVLLAAGAEDHPVPG